MRKLSCWSLIFLVLLLGCANTRPADRSPEMLAAGAAYEELLALYPEDHQGLGRERAFPTVEEQPMTYGLLLSAEAARYHSTHADESRRRIRKAMNWLLDNQDLDHDGKPGWGLPQEWDAFQDGSTNPVNQPYTITTALVLNGVLDTLPLPIWSNEQRERIRSLVGKVAVRWCREMWSDGFGGGYFWYSPCRCDDIFAVNSPSMFMGSLARILYEQPDALRPDERTLVQARADGMARAVAATVELRSGLPFWDYMPAPNRFGRKSPNDLVHHIYTLWGIEVYRDCGGTVLLPWTRAQALHSVDVFWGDGHIREYAQDVVYTGKEAARQPIPSILWGAGSMLAAYAQWGDHAGAARTLTALRRDYGPWPQLHLRQNAKGADAAFVPRHGAHVLWGLALDAFGPTTRK